MGFYARQVVPRIVNVVGDSKDARYLRRRVCEGLEGKVLELGFGSGLNVPYYPPTITRVEAVDPSDVGWKLAGKRLAESAVPVEHSARDAQSLPFPDAEFDAALSTWTLCTIPDADAALREVRRVLKPGGTLHFIEHGLAPDEDEKVRRWQYRLDRLEQLLFDGCHLTRPIVDLLTDAGFVLTELDVFYEKGAPKPMGADSLGIAVVPG